MYNKTSRIHINRCSRIIILHFLYTKIKQCTKNILFIPMFQTIDVYAKKNNKMSEYCEYMWCDPARGHNSVALARSIYEEGGRFDKRDKKLAIKTVRAVLRQMPDVGT